MEIEIKFYLPELGSVRKSLLAVGATSSGRHFEVNLRFDDASERLRHAGRLLRLRKDTAATLTFKRPPTAPSPEGFKVFEEIEVQVGDFEKTCALLRELGFQPVQRYEKYRETLISADQTHFCLDTMPYGHFLEIEGRPEAIRTWTKHLQLNWDQRILSNYLSIFETIRQKAALEFSEVTFDNFKNVRIDPAWIQALAAMPSAG